MSTITFKTASTIAGGVGTPVTGDTANQTERDILIALGASPGSGATFNWKPHLPYPVLNAKLDYDAKFDGNTDDISSLQGACDDALTGAVKRIALYPGPAAISKPLWVKASGTGLIGARQGFNQAANPSSLKGTFAAGPSVFIGGAGLVVPNIVTALVTGAGSAWQMVGNTYWFNLRDSHTLDLHGKAAFTVRGFFTPTDGLSGVIVTSAGKLFTGDVRTLCFQLGISGAGKFFCTLKTSVTGTVTLTAPSACVAGVMNEVEASYDGSTFRLFIDGTSVANSAMTGTLMQGVFEDVTVGPAFSAAGEQNVFQSAAKVTLDSLEIADMARNTTDYTKHTSKYPRDAHTLALMNFVTQYGPFTIVDVNAGNHVFYAWCRQDTVGIGAVNSGEIDGVCFLPQAANTVSGIFTAHSCQNWNYSRVSFLYQRMGLFTPMGDNFFSRMTDIEYQPLSSTGRFGIFGGGNSGLATLTNFTAIGGIVPLFLMSPGVTINGGWILANGDTVFDAVFKNNASDGGPFVVNSIAFSTEVGVGAGFRGTVGVGTGGGVTGVGALFHGNTIETANGQPAVIADQTDTLEFTGPNFNTNGAPTELISVLGAVRKPVVLRSPSQTGSFVQWSGTAGAVTVDLPGRMGLAFSATPTIDFSKASQWTLDQLTDNVTAQTWENAGDGQPVVVRYHQHDSAAKTVASPSNVIGWTAISATLGSISEFRGSYDQGLGKFVGSMFAGLT